MVIPRSRVESSGGGVEIVNRNILTKDFKIFLKTNLPENMKLICGIIIMCFKLISHDPRGSDGAPAR